MSAPETFMEQKTALAAKAGLPGLAFNLTPAQFFITGAGIGALISVPGQDPTRSNVILTAHTAGVEIDKLGGSTGKLDL